MCAYGNTCLHFADGLCKCQEKQSLQTPNIARLCGISANTAVTRVCYRKCVLSSHKWRTARYEISRAA